MTIERALVLCILVFLALIVFFVMIHALQTSGAL